MNRFFPFVILAVGLFLVGCSGYRLGDVKPSAYEGIDNLFVPPFKNDTLAPRLSSLVTNAFLKELQVDGTYKLTNRANADAVLVATIRSIQKRQLRSVRTDTLQSRELRVYLYIDYHLEDPVSGKRIDSTASNIPVGKSKVVDGEEIIMAQQGRVIGDTIQFVDANFQVGERAAFSVAAEDLATKLVSHLANGW